MQNFAGNSDLTKTYTTTDTHNKLIYKTTKQYRGGPMIIRA